MRRFILDVISILASVVVASGFLAMIVTCVVLLTKEM